MEIGVADGEIVAVSKGLNIRDYNIEVALLRLQKDRASNWGHGRNRAPASLL